MSKNRKNKVVRIIVIILLSLLVIAGGVVIWFSQHYETIVKEKLPGWVASSTDSTYIVTVDEISINIFTRTISLSDVSLKPNVDRIEQLRERHKASNTYFDISIADLKARGIVWQELIGNTEFTCESFVFDKPRVVVTALPEDTLYQQPEKKPSKIERIAANTIKVRDADIEYRNAKTADTLSVFLERGNIELNNWEFRPGDTTSDSMRFLMADDGYISFDTFYYKKKGGLYIFNTGKIEFSSAEQNLKVHDLKLRSAVSRQRYYAMVGHQKEIFTATFPMIEIAGLNWRKAITDSVLLASEVNVNHTELGLYMDRLQPPNTESKLGKFPHQLLQQLELPVYIEKINVKDGHFQYTEMSRETKRAGTLDFSNIHGSITNITNMNAALQKDNHCLIKLRGKFMKKSDMVAHFNLNLDDPAGAFSVTGYLKDLDEWQVNKEAKALAMAEIKSLHLQRMDMSIQGNERSATGHFTILYNDLKLKLQKVKEDGEMKKRGFLSFVANNILIYSDNPMPGEKPRSEDVKVERDIYKSFFNLIWSAMFDAAKNTAARNDDVVNMLGKNKNKKTAPKKEDGQERKGLFQRIMDGQDKKEKRKKEKDKEKNSKKDSSDTE